MRMLRWISMFAVGMIASLQPALAQEFPAKPVRIVVGAPGGSSDIAARTIGQSISGPLGQPVVVDNRATGPIAAEVVAKSAPDGYTLTLTGGMLWIAPLLQKVPYDAIRDFSPITQITREINVLAVHPALPVKSVQDLIALAKAKPGALNYASGGVGTASFLASELFTQMAGVRIVRVSYKGLAQGMTDLISGEVQLAINDAGTVMPHVKSGRLRGLAVTSATPSALAPGLPTIASSGLPGYESVGLSGIWAPIRTPQSTVNRLSEEIIRSLNMPDIKQKFFDAGVEVIGSTPEQFAAMIKADRARIEKVIKDAGIKAE